MRQVIVLLLAALVASGCHARLKRHAPEIDAVRTQAFTNASPNVRLGRVHGDGLAALAVDVVQSVREIEQSRRIARAVDMNGVNYALQVGIAETLGEGPPFAYTDDPAAPTLQLEVQRVGLFVPYLGAPGQFHYHLRARLYRADGRRIYRTRLRCSTGMGDPSAAAVALSAVDNVRQLEQMSDEQIHDAFAGVAWWCGQLLVTRMRRHASR